MSKKKKTNNEGESIHCPVCGQRGTILLDRAGEERFVAHVTDDFFEGRETGELIPVKRSTICEKNRPRPMPEVDDEDLFA